MGTLCRGKHEPEPAGERLQALGARLAASALLQAPCLQPLLTPDQARSVCPLSLASPAPSHCRRRRRSTPSAPRHLRWFRWQRRRRRRRTSCTKLAQRTASFTVCPHLRQLALPFQCCAEPSPAPKPLPCPAGTTLPSARPCPRRQLLTMACHRSCLMQRWQRSVHSSACPWSRRCALRSTSTIGASLGAHQGHCAGTCGVRSSTLAAEPLQRYVCCQLNASPPRCAA